jgi:hypothetical protein
LKDLSQKKIKNNNKTKLFWQKINKKSQ